MKSKLLILTRLQSLTHCAASLHYISCYKHVLPYNMETQAVALHVSHQNQLTSMCLTCTETFYCFLWHMSQNGQLVTTAPIIYGLLWRDRLHLVFTSMEVIIMCVYGTQTNSILWNAKVYKLTSQVTANIFIGR